MVIKGKKGLGLLGKVILFSLVPSYVIAGVLVYLYDRDLKETITQKYIEEALSAASVIQNRIPPADFLKRPTEAIRFLEEMIQINPNFLKINIYAEVDGTVKTVASTDPEQIGQATNQKYPAPLCGIERKRSSYHQVDGPALETIAPY